MPLPAAAPLIPPAAGAFAAGAAAAGKSLVFYAAPLLDTLSYAGIAAWLFRYIWKNKVPEWAKQDVSFRNLLRGSPPNETKTSDEETNNLSASEKEELEMSNVSSVLEKLQALVRSVQLDDDHPSMLQQYAALLAYVQLAAQVKREEQLGRNDERIGDEDFSAADKEEEEEKKHDLEEHAWTSRDSLYENSRTSDSPMTTELQTELQEALRFATYAYYYDPDTLSHRLASDEDCSLLEHSLATSRPGVAAYYLAMSSLSQKKLILGIRGTSTFEDIVTDCCGRSVPLDDRPYYYDHDRGTKRNRTSNFLDPSRIEVQAAKPNEVVDREEEVEVISGHEQIWVEQHSTLPKFSATGSMQGNSGNDYHLLHCHEGIMVSARRLVDTIQEHIEYWVLQRGYQLQICGHSLGSGVASLAAVLLRSRLPELTHDTKTTLEGERPRTKMHVYCFAPPPVLDKDTALAVSSYCTSIVNNADLIPRCSIENLLVLLEILKGVWKELQRKELAPTGTKSTAAFFKRIAKGSDGDMLMTAPALRKLMMQSLDKVQSDAESKRLKSENAKHSQKEKVPPVEDCEPIDGSSTQKPPEKDSAKVTESDEDYHPNLYIPGVVLVGYQPWEGSPSTETNLDTDSLNDDISQRPFKWIVTDGQKAKTLRFLEMDASSRMFMDHTTTSYYSLLDMEYQF